MNLTESPDVVNWPSTHFVYIEKKGSIPKIAPKSWQELQKLLPQISKNNQIAGYMSLYKVEPEKVYRAGVALASEPKNLPEGVHYEEFKGGKYSRFVLTGPYSELPAATSRVFKIVENKPIPTRDDYCMENYVNDPQTTPEKQLVTQILIPTA